MSKANEMALALIAAQRIGYAAGQLEMRERAAKALDEAPGWHELDYGDIVRALEIVEAGKT